MVVQVALLAERLGAKRAQDLQSKVLGSIVAVKIPPGWESYSTELMEALPKQILHENCECCPEIKVSKTLSELYEFQLKVFAAAIIYTEP